MSILDTFYILFKTNAEDAAEDIEDVDKASDKAEKGLKDVDAAAQGVGRSFINMAKQLAAPLLALASVGSLVNIAMDRAAAVRELDAFSVKLNSSISDVDAFQRSIKGLGGETAGAVDSLVKLGEKVNEAFSDKESGARKDFEAWGLAFKNAKGEALGATDAMMELAKNLEGVSNAEALARIKKLGIEDATTIEALMLGRRTLEEHIRTQKEMGVVTEENASAVRDYYAALGDAQNLLTSIGNQILTTFLPIATQAIEIFGDVVRWILKNQDLVEGFFVGISAVVTAKYLPAMLRAAWATAAALWPYIALGAAVLAVAAAFALAYEDVKAFMNGQPSLIGALAEKYEWFGKIVKGIGEWFKDNPLSGWVASAVVALKLATGVGDKLISAMGFGNTASAAAAGTKWGAALGAAARVAIVAAFAGIFLEIMQQFDPKGNLGGITKPIDDAIRQGLGIKAKDEGVTPGEIWRGLTGNLSDEEKADVSATPVAEPEPEKLSQTALDLGFDQSTLFKAQEAINAAASLPISSQTDKTVTQPVTNNDITNTVNVGGVAVHTQAVDASGVAAAVQGALKKQLQTTAAQLDDGVAK